MSDQNEYEGHFEEAAPAPPPAATSAITTTSSAELAITAMAAREARMVEARYIAAERRPRSLFKFREKLLERCKSSEFAEIAIYAVPRGKKKNEETGQWEPNIIRDVSIRFVEEALRNYPHIDVSWVALYDDDTKRICRCTIMDYEVGSAWWTDVTIPKTVERSRLGKGQTPISVRSNSFGERVYVVPATPAEVETTEAAMRSKASRTTALRMLPGEIVAEAKRMIFETRASEVRKDPAKAKKNIVDAFAAIGVTTDMLVEYMGKPVEAFSDDDIVDLRGVGFAIKSREIRWADAVEARHGVEPDAGAAKPSPEVEAKRAETQAKIDAARKRATAPKKPADAKPAEPGDAPPAAAGDVPPAKPTPKPAEQPAEQPAASSPSPGDAKPKHDPTTHDGQEPPADWKGSGS